MKFIRILYIACLLSTLSVFSGAPALAQAPEASYRVSSNGRVNLKDFHVDPTTRDMYLIGELDNSITFSGWGAGKISLGDDPLTKDFFYAHHDAEATGMKTLLRFSVNGTEAYLSKMAVSSQYAYVIGSFTGTLTVYDHNGNALPSGSVVSSGDTDAFLLKVNKESGALAGVFKIGNSGRDFGDNIIIDRKDNVIVSGRFNGSVSFAIGPIISLPVASQGNDLFVARYSPGNAFLNLAVFGGPENQDKIVGLATDTDNNVFVAGRFN